MNGPTKTLIFSSTVANLLALVKFNGIMFAFFAFLPKQKNNIAGVLAALYVSIINVSILKAIYFPKWIKKELTLSEYIAENFIWYSIEPLYLFSMILLLTELGLK